MKYWHVFIMADYCGTDEDFIVTTNELDEEDVLTGDFIDYYYTYSDGFAGLTLGTDEEVENGEADETYDEYRDSIWENSYCEEISETEYKKMLELGYTEIEL